MTAAKIRLAVAAVLFVGWMSWLGYLAATSGDAIVLSRPQLLVSSAHITAKLTAAQDSATPSTAVTVQKIHWAPGTHDNLKEGAELTISNLESCGRAQGWQGSGLYILPLLRTENGSYVITPTPPSPGYIALPDPRNTHDPRLRIYPETPHTLRQLEKIEEPYHKRDEGG